MRSRPHLPTSGQSVTRGPATPFPALSPTMTFDQAAQVVLGYLHQRMPWGAWTVSRLSEGVQTHVHVDDRGYGIEVGADVAWEDSVCRRMMAGEGPHIAPDLTQVPAYATLPAVETFGLKAYAGMPIVEADGQVFGVLCGLSADTESPAGPAAEGLLELLAGLLGTVLGADRQRERLAHELEHVRLQAHTDPLTGLYNRHAWNEFMRVEEAAHAKFGDPAVVVLVDLDQLKTINDTQGHAAGDAYITRAGRALRAAVGDRHPVARMGGDEFGILLRHTEAEQAVHVVEEMYESLAQAGVAGSIGMAPYTVIKGFPGALAEADEAMYQAKRRRRATVRA